MTNLFFTSYYRIYILLHATFILERLSNIEPTAFVCILQKFCLLISHVYDDSLEFMPRYNKDMYDKG